MDDSLHVFLNRVAARSPTPGGGSVTAVAGALACALARMVAGYSVNSSTPTETTREIELIASRLRRADEMLRALSEEDAVAFNNLTQASKALKENPAEKSRYEEAIRSAMAVPMEVAAVVSNALIDMEALAKSANRNLISDLGIAAALAHAVSHAARYTLVANANLLSNEANRVKAMETFCSIYDHCEIRARTIESHVRAHLERANKPSR